MMLPKAFKQEYCRTCGKPAELVDHPGYRWRCCGKSWVIIGSSMDIANELIFSSIPEEKQ